MMLRKTITTDEMRMIISRRYQTDVPVRECEEAMAHFLAQAVPLPFLIEGHDNNLRYGTFELSVEEWTLVCRSRWTPRKKKGAKDGRQ